MNWPNFVDVLEHKGALCGMEGSIRPVGQKVVDATIPILIV